MASASNPSLDLHIIDIQGPSQERDVKAACNDVLDFYKVKIAEIPPEGAWPIFLHQSKDEWPRARYDGLPNRYNINLTCLKPYSDPSQTIYQFAHELGHIYQWPSDMNRIMNWLPLRLPDLQAPWNNWFIESCCCALSFLCLDEMARTWKQSRRRQRLISKVNPSEYRHKRINESMQKLRLSSKEETASWIHAKLPKISRDCSTDDKDEHKVCAIEIENILKDHPNSWGALCYLGDATENPITDFEKWLRLVPSEEIPLVKALEDVFNYQTNGP